ncbi:LPXTG cell wall anchor domain-containing protein [Nocardiopsis ansamitocini]|uniref:LPXTG-motif cell wall-anchored protein n=1 Tax=Nocardiopsis ansamitocini TaxID=1670832 RepID=A0A9W6UHX6_9ACTN|nr:LPXTG cell wall anchor domain-containing protein [Nocardiopsis ansamitocini]GLU46460.1 hypothetical protein Nans01_08110 [Nocardiopsis ansamitocini]
MAQSTTFHRVLRGGAAFVALGAVGLAAAAPAAAEPEWEGYAASSLAEAFISGETGYYSGIVGFVETWDGSASSDQSNVYGSLTPFLKVAGTTTVDVDASTASATSSVRSARLTMTVEDLFTLQEQEPDEADDEGVLAEAEPPPAPSTTPAPDAPPAPDDTDTGAEAPPVEPTEEATPPAEELPEAGEGSDEVPVEEETPEIAPVLLLDSGSTTLVSGDANTVVDIAFTGVESAATVTAGGDHEATLEYGTATAFGQEPGSDGVVTSTVDVDGEKVPIKVQFFSWADSDQEWATSTLGAEIHLGGEHVGELYIGSSVSVGEEVGEGGPGNGSTGPGKGGGTGDNEQLSGAIKDKVDKGKVDNALPTTGSSLGGLIAAGSALVLGGGGAALYFVRRKKSTASVEATQA